MSISYILYKDAHYNSNRLFAIVVELHNYSCKLWFTVCVLKGQKQDWGTSKDCLTKTHKNLWLFDLGQKLHILFEYTQNKILYSFAKSPSNSKI